MHPLFYKDNGLLYSTFAKSKDILLLEWRPTMDDSQKVNSEVIVVTTNNLPGYEVVEVYGEVFGLIVRSRNLFSNIGASFRTIFGGEVKGYTTLLSDSREHALARLRTEAAGKGANAVLMMRFDSGDIGGVMNEVAAYGTAVKVKASLSSSKSGI
jgi:uncharacterized protein YbjQ (UPF0145 family)